MIIQKTQKITFIALDVQLDVINKYNFTRLICIYFQGTSYTFFTRINAPKARDLIKVLEEAKQLIPEKLAILANRGIGGSLGGPGGYVRRTYINDGGDGAAYYDSGNARW